MTTETKDVKVCSHCGGTGTIIVDALDNTRECICAYRKSIIARLGPELASADFCDTSPLYSAGIGPGDPPIVDKTQNNLIIRGNWSDIISHLKWAIGCKGLKFYHKIITDENLKTVYMGGRTAKVKKEGQETFNSLSDIVSGEDYHLVIIRLGFLGYPNKAMPGILKEALLIRQALTRPTWLIEEPNNPFAPGHHSYNDEVYQYLVRNKYEMVTIDRTPGSKPTEPVSAKRQADESGHVSMGPEEEPVRVKSVRAPNPVPVSNFVDDLSPPGESKNDQWKRKNKKRGGHSGPFGGME